MNVGKQFAQTPASARVLFIFLFVLMFCPEVTTAQISITIGSGTTLTMGNSSQMFLSGDWTNNGAFIPGDGTVIFDGGGTQTITSTSTSDETFNNLTINKSAGDLVINNNVTVTNTLTMSSGSVLTGANILTLGLTAEGTLPPPNGTIIGNFRRYFGTTIGSRLFPVGTASNYRPLTIDYTSAPTSPGSITVSHTDGTGFTSLTAPPDSGVTINQRSLMFWTATDSAIAGGTYNLAITGTGLTGISDPTSLRVVFLTDGTDFGFIGDHSPGSGTTARRDNISGSTNSFGQYYIGIPGDNTPAGSNVTVAIPPVELTFDQVTQAGTTSLTTSSQGPPPPSGFKLGAPPTYYELTTTATFTDNIQVCINYSGISFANESKLKLFHFEDTDGDGSADAWVDRTTTMDPTNHIICASVTSLSPFAIFEPENPIVQAITAPIDPVQVGTTIAATATFTDPSENDTHTAIWDWGDGTTSPGTVDQIADTVSGSHTYTTAGVYTVTLTVTDNDGDSGQSIFQFIVVYDPEGGFVTGGGWINSPAGAYAADSSITGKANFGFVSKYNQGATVPTGETKFNFKVADLNFHSGVYEWLVVAGAKAQYKGTGTINNAGNYGFMLTAIDEALTPSTDVDFFRIKIWDKDNGDAAIYDNQMGDEDDADPTTTIGGGNIKIHKDNTAAAPMAVATSLTAIPEETRLVPAFPNPSNPEVWIPYHLSADNEVFIRIYDVTGHLIRELNLGHQTAGFYDSRAKAAYWDGRNGYGEDVASGLYFYTLQAGSFAATQKLHIKR